MSGLSTNKKLTTAEFIRRAVAVHGEKYDYSVVKYVGSYIKVEIWCQRHGVFWQKPVHHLAGHGCKLCGIETMKHNSILAPERYTTDNKKRSVVEFIKLAVAKHGNKYDYSLVVYHNCKVDIQILCRFHGTFWQRPGRHLAGTGCPLCGRDTSVNKQSLQFDEFLVKANQKYGRKYNYGKSVYINRKEPICISCPDHGDFCQAPEMHIRKAVVHGCPCCAREHTSAILAKTGYEFITKVKSIHNHKPWDLSTINYVGRNHKVIVICRKYGHGPFEIVASSLLNGYGCPVCKESRGESQIRKFLVTNNIKFKAQVKFKTCRDKLLLSFDFAVCYDMRLLLIEYYGRQHFNPRPFGENELKALDRFKLTQKHDLIKQNWCANRKIGLLIITHIQYNEIKNILTQYLLTRKK